MLHSGHQNRVNNDDYDTCPNDIRFMLSLCDKSDVVWDPFVCDGFSQRFMQHLGYATYETDVDFFAHTEPPEVSVIVTNPPFSDKQRVVKHLVTLGVDFVLLLPLSMITTVYWNEAVNSTINTHEWHLYIPNRVLKYHAGGVIKTGCPFNSMFVTCFRRPQPLVGLSVKDMRVTMLEHKKQLPFESDGDQMGEDK